MSNMASARKKRNNLLLNLARSEEIEDVCHTNRRDTTTRSNIIPSVKNPNKRQARFMSIQDQSRVTDSQSSLLNLDSNIPCKRVRSNSLQENPILPSASLSQLQSPNIDTIIKVLDHDYHQISNKRPVRFLTSYFDFVAYTESHNFLGQSALTTSNVEITSSRDPKSYTAKQQSIIMPISYIKRFKTESDFTCLEKSAIQLTSSSGPIKCWVNQTGMFKGNVLMSEINYADNYTILQDSCQKPNYVLPENEKENFPSSSQIKDYYANPEPSCSSTSEPPRSDIPDYSYRPRKRLRTRGGKSCNTKLLNSNLCQTSTISTGPEDDTSKEACTNIESQLISIIGGTSSSEENSNATRASNVPKNMNMPLSDDQLLHILGDCDEDLDDYIIDDTLFENIHECEGDENESDQSDAGETELAPVNDTERINWSNQPSPCIIPFEGSPVGLKVQPGGSEPIHYFNLIMTDECLQMIVNKSNNNAVKILSASMPGSRIRYWKDITLSEFKIFLGLLFHMGTIKLNRIQDYWKKHRLFNLTCFSNYMSRNRFLLILRVLHFEDQDAGDNRLAKISPLVTYFNDRMRTIYFPSNSLCIDESLVLWRGRLLFRQYIKNKRHKYGVKLYVMTDNNGVILKIIVYAGAGDTCVGGTNHAAKVVTNLLQDYVNKGYSVYMDNFYNSVDLAENLLSLKTFCTGTLRQNRKHNPKEVIAKKLKAGEYIAQYNNKGVCVMKWRDKRDVLLISSQYDSRMVPTTTRRQTEVIKPNIVVNYNKNMGGIDHQDQMLAYYSCEHKTVRWYKKLGIHLLQQMLYNSFTLYNLISGNKKSLYDFRLSVIENLVPDTRSSTSALQSSILKIHVIQPCPRKGKTMRRRCKFCWETKKQRKDTPFYCPDCSDQPGFCIINCFKMYHNY